MSKYGSGVSIKSVIRMECEEVEKILDKYRIAEEDKEVVMSAMKEMAYQWCFANANACAYEVCVPYKSNPMKLVTSKKWNEKYMRVMADTYPNWGGNSDEGDD